MLESLLQKDAELLIFLNRLGSEQWDGFWLALTNQFHWSPLFAFILLLLFKNFGWKHTLLLIVFIAALVAFSDQFTNFIKHTFQRPRPSYAEGISDQIRQFSYKSGGYSFYSGHASLSTTFTFFIVLLLRKRVKYIYLLFIFPILFGYSRIYLGVHYPLDICIGYLMGFFWGYVFYRIQKALRLTTRFRSS